VITSISPGLDVYSIDTSASGDTENFAAVPALMIWDEVRSRWEKLLVASCVRTGASAYDVTIYETPVATVAAGSIISPSTKHREAIAESIEAYFDGLGPGQVVASTDPRFSRSKRWPPASIQGSDGFSINTMGAWISDAIGPALGALGVELIDATPSLTSVPATPYDGPRMLTIGHVGIEPRST
jgi:uncharacterized membrane protein